jgi:hypothetical protein
MCIFLIKFLVKQSMGTFKIVISREDILTGGQEVAHYLVIY